MALLIIILVIWLMLYLGRQGKEYRAEKSMQRHAAKHREMTAKETDELITVIIPTIKNDK